MSASSKTIKGALPPNSIDTLFAVVAQWLNKVFPSGIYRQFCLNNTSITYFRNCTAISWIGHNDVSFTAMPININL
jgi:hypothetical protein